MNGGHAHPVPGLLGLRRRSVLGAVAAAAGSGVATAWPSRAALAAGQASAFPSHAVRLVVPYSVGIGPDVVARGLAEELGLQWQQPVWVDNKPGASGIVAFGDLRRTAADGHTLFLADTGSLVVNPLLHPQLPYDPLRDLEPLSLLFRASAWPATPTFPPCPRPAARPLKCTLGQP